MAESFQNLLRLLLVINQISSVWTQNLACGYRLAVIAASRCDSRFGIDLERLGLFNLEKIVPFSHLLLVWMLRRNGFMKPAES